MTGLKIRQMIWLAATGLVISGGPAQSHDDWPACQVVPTRACVLTEAIGRLRDDAPQAHDAKFAEWHRLLYLRLSEIASITRNRELFDEARRSAEANPEPETRRSALRWVAAGQARAGFPDEALATLADGDHGGFAAGEIALALALAGRPEEALATVRRLDEPEAKVRALVRLAGATCSAHWLRHATALVADIGDESAQSGLWSSIAIAYAQLWQRDSALRIAGLIATGYRRAEALAGIAAAIHDGRLLEDARNYAGHVPDHSHQDETWAALARAEIALGALQQAYQTLRAKLPSAASRALAAAVGELAAVYWLNGDPSGARKVIDELLGGSWTIGEARTVLARRLIAADRLDDARQLSFLVDEITFDTLSAEIALKQAGNHAFTSALMTADSIQHPGRRSPTLAEISALLPE